MVRKSGHPLIRGIVLILFLLLAATAESGIADKVFETGLENGLRVILLENHKAPVITFQVWYRVGSRNEEFGKTGLSHLLEHMMFKGTKDVSAEEFTRTIQENGGNYNAFTSKDFTAYFETLSSERIGIALRLEADRMQHLVLREEDFLTERNVVMEERRLRTEDNPQAYLTEQMEAAAFEAQPYHWPIIGWSPDLQRLTLEDASQYYKTYYVPANAFLVVVGDFQRGELLSQIEEIFDTIPSGKEPTTYSYKDPPQTGERRVIAKREARLPFLVMGYHVPNLKEEDSYALEVAAALLSEGKSSRLYKRLVLQDQLALSVDAQNSLLSVDPSLFCVSAEPLPGKDLKKTESVIEEELEKLKKKPVEQLELQKAKNQIEASFLFGQDSLFYQAMMLARYEIAGGWQQIDDYIPAIRKVTPEDIKRVADKYFTKENRTTGTLVPLPLTKDKAKRKSLTSKEAFKG